MEPGPVRILLVEDSEAEATLVERLLTRPPHTGYAVTWVERAAVATDRLASRSFDAILLDLNLPDSRGTETLDLIAAAAKGVPIVVLTGDDDEELGLCCVKAGAQDFLGKDALSAGALHRRIEYALLRGRRARALDETVEHYRRLVADYEHRAADDTTQAPAHRAVVLSHELSVELSASYANVLHAYLEHVREGAPRPIEAMRALIERLHNLHAGRSEVIRLHAKALQEALRGIGAEHEHDYAMEGRMLAIEMMGLLLERYRADVRALDQ